MSRENTISGYVAAGVPSENQTNGVFPAIAQWFSRRRVYALGVLALLVIAAVLIGNHKRYRRWDFVIYYSWWADIGHGIDPWQPPPPVAGQPRPTPCNYTPPYVVWFSPLAGVGMRPAFWIWESLQLAGLIGAIVLLAKELRPRPGPRGLIAAVAVTLLYPQVHDTLHAAQPALLLLFFACAAWVLSRHRRDAAGGLMFAMAVLLKAYPAAAGGYFLFRHRFRFIAWLAGFFAIGVVLSGLRRWLEFLHEAGPSLNGFLIQERMVAMLPNVYQLPLHLSSAPWPLPVVAALSLAAILVLIALAAWATGSASHDAEVDGLCFGLWLEVALLAAPISYDQELPLLLPIYLFAFAALLRGRKTPKIASALMVTAVLFTIAPVFWEWLRHFQIFFLAALATFAAALIMIRSWSNSQVPGIAGETAP